MNALQTNYQALETDDSEAPHESVIFHVATEGAKSRWNHVEDLDSFFRKVYTYHQKHGFMCILTEELLHLVTFVFVIFGAIYAFNCVTFDFDEYTSPFPNATEKTQFGDLFIAPSACAANFGVLTWISIALGIAVTFQRLYKFIVTVNSYKEIKDFYSTAMKISNDELENITWHEVQVRLREVQHEQQMCVHKSDLTELDIYHRILRHKNYMVALVNKNILPLKQNIKFVGEWVYLSSGLKYNIELLLFVTSLSPFKGTGSLKDEYKKYTKRKEIAAELSRNILWLGIANFVLAPFIFVWQVLIFFVKYSGFIRKEPSFLGTRTWSLYSRLYLRHFNELDHELDARLNRAYRPSKEYLESFTSHIVANVAKFIVHIVGSITVALVVWGVFKEPLFQMNYILVIIAVGSCIFVAASSCIPDENTVFHPDRLMLKMIADVHYVPDHWINKAHTIAVRDEFSQIFQFKFIYLFEELLSPIITPYILVFQLRHRALDIVDFFRSFTVDVAGVGDVCSFALMDVSRHGNHHWFSETHTTADQYQQAEDGKTEMSLIHFTKMNPHWKPPPSSDAFMINFNKQVSVERGKLPGIGLENALYNSLNSFSTMGSRYASLVSGYVQQPRDLSGSLLPRGTTSDKIVMSGGVHRAEGPPYLVQGGILSSLHGNEMQDSRYGMAQSGQADFSPIELRAADMSLNALYLHEVHQRHLESNRSIINEAVQSADAHEGLNEDEHSPLLEVKRLP